VTGNVLFVQLNVVGQTAASRREGPTFCCFTTLCAWVYILGKAITVVRLVVIFLWRTQSLHSYAYVDFVLLNL